MTKFEFIQEAALRLITAKPDATMGQIADWATDLAGEFFHEYEQPTEPEVLTAFPDGESVQVVAKEIARLEALDVEERKAKYRYGQKGGLDVRFLGVCKYGTGYGINTVKDLIAIGRDSFSRFHNMGPKTMRLLDKALDNLYNIKSW